jgi:hypothetical protein
MRRTSFLFMTIFVVNTILLLAGCSSVQEAADTAATAPQNKTVESITVEGPSEVGKGETIVLEATGYDAEQNVMEANPHWSVSDKEIAGLSKNRGETVRLTGKSVGMVFIEVAQNKASASHAVQVK